MFILAWAQMAVAKPKPRPSQDQQDGRAQNRSGKKGSHLLRAALRAVELPEGVLGPELPLEAVTELTTANSQAGLSYAEMCQPLSVTGTSLQKQLILSACKKFCNDGSSKPADVEAMDSICNRFLFTPWRPQSSLTAEADKLKVARASLRSDLLSTASAVWQAGLAAWEANIHTVCDRIKSGGFQGIALIKARVYDETPLKLRVESTSSQQVQVGAKAEACVAKVMQTRFRVGVLIKEMSSGRLCFFKGIVPTVLQALERTRGEDICLSQSRIISSIPGLDAAHAMFRHNLDLTTADRYMANAKAESGLQSLRPWDVPLHIDCQVHKVSTSVTWALKVSERHVSGLIASSLVLRQAGALASFREHLLAEIQSNFLVVHGRPSDDRAEEYREQVYAMFLSTDLAREADVLQLQDRRAQQKAVLSRFLCGDLQDPCVHFYTGSVHATEDQLLHVLKTFVIPALVPSAMPTYARHRWLGGEQAVDYVGLIESHHNLFSRTIRRMYKLETIPEPICGPMLQGWAAVEAEVLQNAQREDAAVDAFLEADEALNEGPNSQDAQGWAEFNKSMQKKLQSWTCHDLAVLSLLRRVMTISANLLQRLLKRSSQQWDKDQD